MSNIDDGGPAFPGQVDHGAAGIESFVGMTLRDYFAAKASEDDIKDILEWKDILECTNCSRQEARYIHADAMLKARGNK
jgi:hypothetical protein